MADNPIKEMILQSAFTLKGKDINDRYNKSESWEMKNALRELNQKRIKNDPIIKKKKNECRVKHKTGLWECPNCKEEVNRLTCAHIGTPVSNIIDKILLEEQYLDQKMSELYKALRSEHDDISIAICCDKCNKLLESD